MGDAETWRRGDGEMGRWGDAVRKRIFFDQQLTGLDMTDER
jgi:hypothetical protein